MKVSLVTISFSLVFYRKMDLDEDLVDNESL